MLTVKTARDLEYLRRGSALHPRYLGYLEELFGQLREALCDGDQEEFDLEPHGYIVVIERGDDPHALPGVGLGTGGLLAAWPPTRKGSRPILAIDGFRKPTAGKL